MRLVETAPIAHRVVELRIEHIIKRCYAARTRDSDSLVRDRDYRSLASTSLYIPGRVGGSEGLPCLVLYEAMKSQGRGPRRWSAPSTFEN